MKTNEISKIILSQTSLFSSLKKFDAFIFYVSYVSTIFEREASLEKSSR